MSVISFFPGFTHLMFVIYRDRYVCSNKLHKFSNERTFVTSFSTTSPYKKLLIEEPLDHVVFLRHRIAKLLVEIHIFRQTLERDFVTVQSLTEQRQGGR